MTARIVILLAPHDDATLHPHYGIDHDGDFWLVTAWLVNREKEVAQPERMIRLDRAAVTPCDPGMKWDYTVSTALPKDVLEGRALFGPAYETRNFPETPVANSRDLKNLPTFP